MQDTAGCPLHRGGPRELFIKSLLGNQLGKTGSFGTGEIIDVDSKP